VAANPTPLEKIRSDIPAPLLTVVRKAMTKDIHQRYQSAGEMRNDLAAFSGSVTVMQPLAGADAAPVKRRLSRREMALLTLLVLALGGLAWQVSRGEVSKPAPASSAVAPARTAEARTAPPPAPAAPVTEPVAASSPQPAQAPATSTPAGSSDSAPR
jgi:hypothetical protein